MESADSGVAAAKVANRSGVGVEAEGMLQANTKTTEIVIHHARDTFFICILFIPIKTLQAGL